MVSCFFKILRFPIVLVAFLWFLVLVLKEKWKKYDQSL